MSTCESLLWFKSQFPMAKIIKKGENCLEQNYYNTEKHNTRIVVSKQICILAMSIYSANKYCVLSF